MAYLFGFDAALAGSTPDGFREFLCMRTGAPNNCIWPSYVRIAAGDEPAQATRVGPVDEGRQQHCVETLFELLDEFLTAPMAWTAVGRSGSVGPR